MKNRRNYVIAELNSLGIYENLKSVPLEKLEYRELLGMLAVARAVAS
ncbi:hypothetical protein ACFPRA_01460 [Sporosarcina soli]|uniref:Fur-regulated basic protein A n=1 Tax=Sporosarcina soli TaxID=334736 RepID=A0ABW0TDT1_9BACL